MTFQRGALPVSKQGHFNYGQDIVMAFSPPVVGCLVKKRLAEGGFTGTPGPPLAAPLFNIHHLRTFALIVCAQPFCAGNATVICHASLRLTAPEDKHGVENAGEKKFRPSLLLWIIGDPYFLNHESLTLLTIYKI